MTENTMKHSAYGKIQFDVNVEANKINDNNKDMVVAAK